MTYSELLQKVLSGIEYCNGDNAITCCDCPYISYSLGANAQVTECFYQQALRHDKDVLINIMKYLDEIQVMHLL